MYTQGFSSSEYQAKDNLKTEKAGKIIQLAEKNILQARVKSINYLLDNISKQAQLCYVGQS